MFIIIIRVAVLTTVVFYSSAIDWLVWRVSDIELV